MQDFSKDGRKLRPRKAAATGTQRSEKVEFNHSERPRREFAPKREFGPGRESVSGHPEGENKPRFGKPSRSYGEGRPSFGGPRRPYGEGRQSRPYGEGRPARPYNNPQEGEEKRSFGDRKPSFGGPGRSFGGRKPSTGGPKRSFGGPGKRSFGGPKRSFGPKRSHAFDEHSEEGINRMISRRPLVEDTAEAQEISVPIFKEEVRLNKFIANSGVCSRREADTLIQAGVVTVNGEVVTELGVKINVTKDDIRFNGQRLKGEEKVYIIINKPKGFVTTASDPHAEKTIMDLVKGCSSRVYPVGRLDKNTTGVLMLTNDGEIAERLSHPAYEKKKIYQVSLDKELKAEDYETILAGITLSDGPVNADSLEYIDEGDKRKLGIEIHSGKNRIVRRIFEHLGYNVKALDRVYFAGLTKKGLKKGEWRYLSESEVNILRMGAYM